MDWDGAKIRHIRNYQVTVRGLDTGIHAGMTAFFGLSEFDPSLAIHRPMKDVETNNTMEFALDTDWDKLRNLKDNDINKAIASDLDPIPTDDAFWETAVVVIPKKGDFIDR